MPEIRLLQRRRMGKYPIKIMISMHGPEIERKTEMKYF
jgi:hypothetical protein